jgi:hypothetical protein
LQSILASERELVQEVGFAEIAIDVLQTPFWITSVWPTTRELRPLLRASLAGGTWPRMAESVCHSVPSETNRLDT